MLTLAHFTAEELPMTLAIFGAGVLLGLALNARGAVTRLLERAGSRLGLGKGADRA